MRPWVLAAIGLALASFGVPAFAQQPEQLEQLETGKGEWQAEYFGTFAKGDGDGHAIEAMIGISDRLAIGLEIEAETREDGLSIESLGPKLLYRISGDDAPVMVGVQVQVALGEGASLDEAEARLIAERKDELWWAQANGMVRRSNGDGAASTGLAYAWSVQHSLGKFSWLGIEGSGGSRLIAGRNVASDNGHFVGPSLTFEIEPAPGREIEIGLAAFRRIGGDGPRNAVRVFAQFGF